MEVKTYAKAADFLSVTRNLLQSDEVRYGLIYGIARRVAVNPHHYGEEDPWFCTVADNAGVSALAWRTPPHPVGLAWHTGDPEEAVSLLIEAVRNNWQKIPGVTGHREVTDLFAGRWSDTYGISIQSTMAQRIYRLDAVDNVPSVPGRMRPAATAERDLISRWVWDFNADVYGESSRDLPETNDILPRIARNKLTPPTVSSRIHRGKGRFLTPPEVR